MVRRLQDDKNREECEDVLQRPVTTSESKQQGLTLLLRMKFTTFLSFVAIATSKQCENGNHNDDADV